MPAPIDWLLGSSEPWTRYRTRLDLLGQPSDDPAVQHDRQATLDNPQILGLMTGAATWVERPIKRHNDASHPLAMLTMLVDFGIRAGDAGMGAILQGILARQSLEGAYRSLVSIPQAYGGSGADQWAWVLCDAPVMLYVVSSLLRDVPSRPDTAASLERAAQHLLHLMQENGWRCVCASELGRFRGPGRKDDPCPIANLYALKALAALGDRMEESIEHEVRVGAEVLLSHWEHQAERKMYMFGIGSDYRKLKYPFVWYDILHVVDVLSRFSFVHADPRYRAMVATITAQTDGQGRYTAGSMYQAWKGWSFADKKAASPWLTFLVWGILKRLGTDSR
jgi:hypothetical protein